MMETKDRQLMEGIKTPAYVIDERLLKKNLSLLKKIQDETGAKILLALKGFSMYSQFQLVGDYLSGITSSSLNEALLGRKHMNKEVHIYAPAYRPDEVDRIAQTCDHVVFNSVQQIQQHQQRMKSINPALEFGLRVNPEYSEVAVELYDPCALNSRLGAVDRSFSDKDLQGIDGLHFHTMCEQDADTLERTLKIVEAKFGSYLHKVKWLNFGGGHHITREGYDVSKLINLINKIQSKYQVQVYLEPGEAIALNVGYLVTSVLDIIDTEIPSVIIDSSAACHMPDVLEMPYKPVIISSTAMEDSPYIYRIGGLTCLAGDIIGDYGFDRQLKVGDQLIFTDMAHYTMVKNNTFNGVNLPDIALLNDHGLKIIKTFGYEDYEGRLS